MSDESQTPPPDGPPDQPFSRVSEAELDAILAQAGSLVEGLSAELGLIEEARDESQPANMEQKEPTSLDEELAQLEKLVTATSQEVHGHPAAPPDELGTDSAQDQPVEGWDSTTEAEFKSLFPDGNFPPPPPPDVVRQAMTPPEYLNMPTSLTNPQLRSPTPSRKVEQPSCEEPPDSIANEAPADADQNDDHIPDFMREFMEPAAEAPPETPLEPTGATPERIVETTSMPIQMKPGVVGTGLLHKVIRPSQAESQEEEEEETPVEVVPLTRVGRLRAPLNGLLRLLRRIPSPRPALGRIAYIMCDKVIALLEKVDKPTERLEYRLRVFIGWVAIATLCTSFVVYVVSLF